MRSFTINALGPFTLTASIALLQRFGPVSFGRTDAGDLDLAFVAERGWQPVGVRLCQRRNAINGQFWGDAPAEDVRRQVQRILSLDVDARPFAAMADRDPVVGALQSRYPGLRPVGFLSVYEAAVWAVIGHRVKAAAAVDVRHRLVGEFGHDVVVDDTVLRAFPAPQRLVALPSLPGVADRKAEYLRAVAAAAVSGDLDGDRLRDLPRDEALARLRLIPGISGAAAELILVGGAGDPDVAPRPEPRLAAGIAAAYHLDHPPSGEEFVQITDRWRPFRSWVAFLMRARADAWDLPS